MANPYGMVMGLDGRWEYDPKEYTRSVTNARFRTPFPYMGVGSLGAGLMTHSPLAGLGSEIPGIRGPGGAPAWGAGLGASPLYSPSFSTEAVSPASGYTKIGHEPRYAETISPEDLAAITKSIDPDSKWDSWATEGVPFYPGTTTRDYDPRTDTTIVDPPTLTIPEVDTFRELPASTISPELSSVFTGDSYKVAGPIGWLSDEWDATRRGLEREGIGIGKTDTMALFDATMPGTGKEGSLTEDMTSGYLDALDHFTLSEAPVTSLAWSGLEALTEDPVESLYDDYRDRAIAEWKDENPTGTLKDFSLAVRTEPHRFPLKGDLTPGEVSMHTDPLLAGYVSLPSAYVGSVSPYDADVVFAGKKYGLPPQAPVTPAAQPRPARIAVQSPLANPDITVANTIAEQVAQTEATVNAMGLTGATAAAAAAAVNASQGYVTADMYAGFQEAQQAQDQAEAVAQAQAAASAAAVAASAASDPGNGWGGEDTGVTAGPAGAPQGAHHAGSNVSNIVDAVVANALAEARGRAAAEDKVNQDIMAALDDMRGGYGGWSGGDDAGMGDYGGSDTGGGGGGGYGI